jgi:hypothetical protein
MYTGWGRCCKLSWYFSFEEGPQEVVDARSKHEGAEADAKKSNGVRVQGVLYRMMMYKGKRV